MTYLRQRDPHRCAKPQPTHNAPFTGWREIWQCDECKRVYHGAIRPSLLDGVFHFAIKWRPLWFPRSTYWRYRARAGADAALGAVIFTVGMTAALAVFAWSLADAILNS